MTDRMFYVTAYYTDNSRAADTARQARRAHARWIEADERTQARAVATTFVAALSVLDRADLVRVTVFNATEFFSNPDRYPERTTLLTDWARNGYMDMERARQFQFASRDSVIYRLFDPSPFNWVASKANGQAGTLMPAWNPGAERLWLTAYLLKHAYAVHTASYNEENHCCMMTLDEAIDRVVDGATDFEAERDVCSELIVDPSEELWDWVERVLDHAKRHPGDARDDALANELDRRPK